MNIKPANIQSVSYFKNNMAALLQQLNQTGEPLLLTQNGKASMVLVDPQEYEDTQATLDLLRLVANGEQQIKQGTFASHETVMKQLEKNYIQ